MSVREMQRAVVTSSVRLARFPVDTAVRFAPGLNESVRGRIGNHVDRWEAGVRRAAGTLLADDELRIDAARKEAAVDLREDGAELLDDEVLAVVEDLLLSQRVAGHGDLCDRHAGGAVPNDERRRDTRRHDLE